MHSILIYLIIIIIVVVQIKVAKDALAQIKFLKDIIPGNESFETISVYIPESQIKTISTEHILKNPERFGPPQAPAVAAENQGHEAINLIVPEIQAEVTEVSYDALIWVIKDNEKKEIPFKLLRRYEQLGWEQIN